MVMARSQQLQPTTPKQLQPMLKKSTPTTTTTNKPAKPTQLKNPTQKTNPSKKIL
jgi:hypothetical protein